MFSIATTVRCGLTLVLGSLGASAALAQQLTSTLISDVFDRPVMLTSPPGDARLFVCESHTGRIRIYENGIVLPAPFLDIGTLVSTGTEQGLLGLAFHPDYASNGHFYVSYTDTGDDLVVRRYSVSAGDPNQADDANFDVVFGPLFEGSHSNNGGCLEFGPDGMLYFGVGDGVTPQDILNHAQDLTVALGKILRFDVDLPFPHVPLDNPFVGDPNALDLIWAYGLKNPWRISFDTQTGDLWIGDVGEADREEISFQPAASPGGDNYGWNCYEGTDCTGYPHSGCSCADLGLVAPAHEYPHDGRLAVIAGHRYRGQLMPSMVGRFVFTDWQVPEIRSFAWDGASVSDLVNHGVPGFGYTVPGSISVDSQGELYVVDTFDGQVWRLEEPCTPVAQSYCLTSPNSVGSGALIGQTGSTSVTANDLVLTVSAASASQPGLFYYGPAQVQLPFGDGFRCVGAGGVGVFRLNPPISTDAAGDGQRPVDLTQPPTGSGPGKIGVGETWNFQFWYRDPAAGGSGFNLSDGLEATFCP